MGAQNALVSGDTGIECFEEIFSQSKSILKKDGFLLLSMDMISIEI